MVTLRVITWPREELGKQPIEGEKEIPTRNFLIQRSDYLDDVIARLRTGAGIFLTLGTGSALISSIAGLTVSYSLVFGLINLAIASFIAIVLSFTSTRVQYEGFHLDSSLISTGQTKLQYLKHLSRIVIKKNRIIYFMELSLGYGFLNLGIYFMLGMVVGYLPNAWVILSLWPQQLTVLLAFVLLFIETGAISYLIFGPKVLGVLDLSFLDVVFTQDVLLDKPETD